jgi:hypothetical protein
LNSAAITRVEATTARVDCSPIRNLKPHSQPIDGSDKAHRKPDQAPNERCDQLGPKRALEGARHREGGIGEQDRRPHEHQKMEYDSPHARDGVYGGEQERREDERQERECS